MVKGHTILRMAIRMINTQTYSLEVLTLNLTIDFPSNKNDSLGVHTRECTIIRVNAKQVQTRSHPKYKERIFIKAQEN